MGSPVSVPMLLVDTACIPVLRWKIGVGTSAGRALEGSGLAEHGKWQLAQFMTQRGNIFLSSAMRGCAGATPKSLFKSAG